MEKITRILYFTFDFLDPIFSGNGTLSRIQIFGLLEKGFEVLVICPKFGDITSKMVNWIQKKKLKILPITIQTNRDLSPSCDWKGFYEKIDDKYDQIAEFQPELIINPDWHAIDAAIQVKERLGVPLISQFFRIFSYFKEYFSNDEEYKEIRKKEHYLVHNSDAVIVLSSFDKEWCIKNGTSSIYILYPPLMDNFVEALSRIPRKKIHLNSLDLITVSRLVPEKCILRIFPCLNEIKKKDIKFSYTLIGERLDENYWMDIQKAIRKYNLEQEVRILGRISLPKLALELQSHSLYVHTSSYEPFGITIIEAFAAGCKVLLDSKGLIGAKEALELFTDGNFIIPIDFDNSKNFIKKIMKLLQSQNLHYDSYKGKKNLRNLESKQYVENLVNIFRDFL